MFLQVYRQPLHSIAYSDFSSRTIQFKQFVFEVSPTPPPKKKQTNMGVMKWKATKKAAPQQANSMKSRMEENCSHLHSQIAQFTHELKEEMKGVKNSPKEFKKSLNSAWAFIKDLQQESKAFKCSKSSHQKMVDKQASESWLFLIYPMNYEKIEAENLIPLLFLSVHCRVSHAIVHVFVCVFVLSLLRSVWLFLPVLACFHLRLCLFYTCSK